MKSARRVFSAAVVAARTLVPLLNAAHVLMQCCMQQCPSLLSARAARRLSNIPVPTQVRRCASKHDYLCGATGIHEHVTHARNASACEFPSPSSSSSVPVPDKGMVRFGEVGSPLVLTFQAPNKLNKISLFLSFFVVFDRLSIA